MNKGGGSSAETKESPERRRKKAIHFYPPTTIVSPFIFQGFFFNIPLTTIWLLLKKFKKNLPHKIFPKRGSKVGYTPDVWRSSQNRCAHNKMKKYYYHPFPSLHVASSKFVFQNFFLLLVEANLVQSNNTPCRSFLCHFERDFQGPATPVCQQIKKQGFNRNIIDVRSRC